MVATNITVFNHKKTPITIKNINKGAPRSSNYTCIHCGNPMLYIPKLLEQDKNGIWKRKIKAYFRHSNTTCANEGSGRDRKYRITNIMSEFHKTWQEIFPAKNKEIRTYLETGGYCIADIRITHAPAFNIQNEEGNNILDKSCTTLTIEIQHSPISMKILEKRDLCYTVENANLLWIFDLKNNYSIEKIVLFDGCFYRIKLTKTHYFPKLFLLEHDVNILLDNGGEWLYQIIKKPILDMEYLETKRVSRVSFLDQLRNILRLTPWRRPIVQTICPCYDYETALLKEKIRTKNLDMIRYTFYLLEKIPSRYFNIAFVCQMLSVLSDESPIVRGYLHALIEKNVPCIMDDDILSDQLDRIRELNNRSDDAIDKIYDTVRNKKEYVTCHFENPDMNEECFGMMLYMSTEYAKQSNILLEIPEQPRKHNKGFDRYDHFMMVCDFIQKYRNHGQTTGSCMICCTDGKFCHIGGCYYDICEGCYGDTYKMEACGIEHELLKIFNHVSRLNHKSNKQTDFYRNWQNTFPEENTNVIMELRDKRRVADIYINGKIIKPQYSPISKEMISDAVSFFRGNLVWIFKLPDMCIIEKIILFNGVRFRIRSSGKDNPMMMVEWISQEARSSAVTIKTNIMLDSGDQYLYRIKCGDACHNEIVGVEQILRQDFLGDGIEWTCGVVESKYDVYDYVKGMSDIIGYIFYVIETIPVGYFCLNYLCGTLGQLSKRSDIIKGVLRTWVMQNWTYLKTHGDQLSIMNGHDISKNYESFSEKKFSSYFASAPDDDCFDIFMHIAKTYNVPEIPKKYRACDDSMAIKIGFIRTYCMTTGKTCVICHGSDLKQISNVKYSICRGCFSNTLFIEKYDQDMKKFNKYGTCDGCKNKKYLPVYDPNGKLINMCIVCNRIRIFKEENGKCRVCGCPTYEPISGPDNKLLNICRDCNENEKFKTKHIRCQKCGDEEYIPSRNSKGKLTHICVGCNSPAQRTYFVCRLCYLPHNVEITKYNFKGVCDVCIGKNNSNRDMGDDERKSKADVFKMVNGVCRYCNNTEYVPIRDSAGYLHDICGGCFGKDIDVLQFKQMKKACAICNENYIPIQDHNNKFYDTCEGCSNIYFFKKLNKTCISCCESTCVTRKYKDGTLYPQCDGCYQPVKKD